MKSFLFIVGGMLLCFAVFKIMEKITIFIIIIDVGNFNYYYYSLSVLLSFSFSGDECCATKLLMIGV